PVASPDGTQRSRSVYVNEPRATFVPLFVVEVMRPPENSPRATSYVFVTIRMERMASCGTLPDPNDMPSSVTLLAVERCPRAEKAVAPQSRPLIPSIPGAGVGPLLKSDAPIGRRAT